MDLKYGSTAAGKFVTNVGMITSRGKMGDNIMSAEWTHFISYDPGIIAVALRPGHMTVENILKSKEFGVNIAAENQNFVSSIAGNTTGREVDKISVLRELGVQFYNARKIKVLMVKNAAMNAECVVKTHMEFGDHVLIVGEAVDVSTDESINPIVYHAGRYYKVGEHMQKPAQEVLDRINELEEKYKRS